MSETDQTGLVKDKAIASLKEDYQILSSKLIETENNLHKKTLEIDTLKLELNQQVKIKLILYKFINKRFNLINLSIF